MKEECIRVAGERGELAVIIVSHNCRDCLRACLDSLRPEVTSRLAEVILVDNNSSDGSQTLVRTSFPWVRLIENKENVGYARANNQGVRLTLADYILFLNPDTVIPPGSISALLEELKKRPDTAAIGPRLVRPTGSYQVSFGKKISFLAQMLQKLFLNPYFRMRLKFSSRPREVGWLSGACLLVRRQPLEEAGLFDENFFLYFEDIDLCYRLRRRGYKLIFFPRLDVLHRGGASTFALGFGNRREYRRSQIYFYQKHNSPLSLFLLRAYLGLLFALENLFGPKGKKEEAALGRKHGQRF